MRRIGFAVGVLALALLAYFWFKPKPPPAPDHVVLIVIDTLRADHLGALGYPRATTPMLDALSKEGVLFRRAYSQSSFTSPSMVSLMTGRYIAKERLDIPSELATLAESFQRAGWRTAAFVSNPLVNAENGFARGFERFETIAEYGSNEPVAAWFRTVADAKSFTYIHITEPHDPYLPPAAQRAHRERPDLLPGDRESFYERIGREMQLVEHAANVAKIREEIGGYDDDVRYADERVAHFMAAMDATGIHARAAIAITADHGEGLWERLALMNGQRGAKLRAGEPPTLLNQLMPTHGNQVSHELVHVPLILIAPSWTSSAPIDTPVENLDLFPTLLELADIAPPSGLQGTSLVPLLDGARAKKDFAFSFTRFNSTVITADGWQLVLPTEEGECAEALVPELYDLNTDPHQRTNLAAAKPDVVERLSKLARERIKIAIVSGGAVNNSSLVALGQLGYIDLAQREEARRVLLATPLDVVLKQLASFNTPCVERLLLAETLAERELDDAARAALREWRAKETAGAVQRAVDAALAK